MQDLTFKIVKELGLNPELQLKKPIRGLPGFTIYKLIEACISSDNIEDIAHYLGYSTNPIKESLRTVLKPLFPEYTRDYNSGGYMPSWRLKLLAVIGYKHCSKCKENLPFSYFYTDTRSLDNKRSRCKSCVISSNKQQKYYIAERTPSWSDLELIANFYKNCPDGYHVDHIIPLKGVNVSGLHVLSNLQYLPASENLKKSNKFS